MSLNSSSTATDTADATPRRAEAGTYGVHPPGYRLPDATHVGRVRLQVADLARSLAYYEDILGFRVLEQAAGRATLGDHDDRALVELHERAGATPVPRR